MNPRYVIGSSATGEILRSVTCESDQLVTQVQPGEVLDLHDTATSATHYFSGGAVVAYPPGKAAKKRTKNSAGAVWSNATMSWVDSRPIKDIRGDAIVRMRDSRDAAVSGGVTWDGSRFDTDDRSQFAILALFVDSKEPDFTSKMVRLADNSWRLMDRAAAAGAYAAMRAHVDAQFAKFSAREAAINAASTADALGDIAW